MNEILPFLCRRGRGLVLIFALIGGLAAHFGLQSQGVRGSDDNLLIYMNGLHVFHGEALDRLNDRAIKYFTDRGADNHAMLRLRLHKVSINEYVLPGTIYYGVSRFLRTLFQPAPSLYPMFLSQSIVFGFFLTFALSLAVLLGVIRYINRPLFIWAVGLTLGLYGLTEFLPLKGNAFATILMHKTFGEFLTHTGSLLLRPSEQFSLLSFTPRSHFTLLLIGLFALRWSRHFLAAYVLLLVLSLYHLSASGLMLISLVSIDLVVRPGIFKSRAIAATLALTTGLFLYRENMWEFILAQGQAPLIVAGGFVIALGAVLALPANRQRFFGPLSLYIRIQGVLIKRGVIAADLILFAIAWFASIIAIYFLIQQLNTDLFTDWSEAFYFWGRVNGRFMTLVFPSFVFGFALLILTRMMRANVFRMRRYGNAIVAILVGVMALLAITNTTNIVEKRKVLPAVAQRFFKAENALQRGALPQLKAMGFSEAILYYGFAKSIDISPRQLDAVMP